MTALEKPSATKVERAVQLSHLSGEHLSWKNVATEARIEYENHIAKRTMIARMGFFKSIFDAWRAGYRKSEIANAIGVSRVTLDRWFAEYADEMGGEYFAELSATPAVDPHNGWTIVHRSKKPIEFKVHNDNERRDYIMEIVSPSGRETGNWEGERAASPAPAGLEWAYDELREWIKEVEAEYYAEQRAALPTATSAIPADDPADFEWEIE